MVQEVQVRRLAAKALQHWYQILLYKREVYPQLLASYLQAWAAYAQRTPLLRFLLLEHIAIRQVSFHDVQLKHIALHPVCRGLLVPT